MCVINVRSIWLWTHEILLELKRKDFLNLIGELTCQISTHNWILIANETTKTQDTLPAPYSSRHRALHMWMWMPCSAASAWYFGDILYDLEEGRPFCDILSDILYDLTTICMTWQHRNLLWNNEEPTGNFRMRCPCKGWLAWTKLKGYQYNNTPQGSFKGLGCRGFWIESDLVFPPLILIDAPYYRDIACDIGLLFKTYCQLLI